MHGIAKALLRTASVTALLSGSLLLPNSASAQFSFPGIQFRVPYVGGGGGGHYRTRHHTTREASRHESSRHERRSKSVEEREPAEHTAQGNGKSAPQPLSAPLKETPAPQGAGSAAPPKPAGGEEPTFSPSR
jgi:hypothetical protein